MNTIPKIALLPAVNTKEIPTLLKPSKPLTPLTPHTPLTPLLSNTNISPDRLSTLRTYSHATLRVIAQVYGLTTTDCSELARYPTTKIEQYVEQVEKDTTGTEAICVPSQIGMFIPLNAIDYNYFLANIADYEPLLKTRDVKIFSSREEEEAYLSGLGEGVASNAPFEQLTDHEIIKRTGVLIPSSSRKELVSNYNKAKHTPTYLIVMKDGKYDHVAYGTLDNYQATDTIPSGFGNYISPW